MRDPALRQLRLLPVDPPATVTPSPAAVHDAFDRARLTQARHLAGITKKALADDLGVSAAAVGQYELGVTRPRPDLLPRLAEILDVPMAFFLTGRPHGRLDASMAHFRSLRCTRVYQRDKALAATEQVWELIHALERRVQLPEVNLPGFIASGSDGVGKLPGEPGAAARALRRHWKLGDGPVNHLIRRMEANGVVVVTPPKDSDSEAVDAFSTSRLPRPIVVLTTNRANDVYRHRFTAAHELGHLVLHADTAPGDAIHEREADAFAAEFLTPHDSIVPSLPGRTDLRRLAELQRTWGVSVRSLLYRCRETGLLSDSAARRAYQRLHALQHQPGFRPEPLADYPGEQPVLLPRAFALAAESGLTLSTLSAELGWNATHSRTLLGPDTGRPALTLIT